MAPVHAKAKIDDVADCGRLSYLDTMRGIAVLAVLLQHAIELARGGLPPDTVVARLFGAVLHAINLGRCGVILFFLVSGFVIPLSLKRDLPRFAIARFFRLYPAYWACIAAGLLVGPPEGHASWTPAQILLNATMLQRSLGGEDLYGQFWTLSVELVFYSFCAGLFALGRLRSARTIGAITLGLLLLADLPPVLMAITGERMMEWREMPVFLPFLFLGTLLHLAVLQRDPLAQTLAKAAIPLALLTAPVVSGALLPHYEGEPLLAPPAATAGMLAALLGFLLALRIRPSVPLFGWLGRISYSAYLFQFVVLTVLLRSIVPGDGVRAMLFVVSAPVAIASVAWLSYRMIEAPMIRLGRAAQARPAAPPASMPYMFG